MKRKRDDFVFGVDLDGVSGDYYGAMRPLAAEWLNVPVESLTATPQYNFEDWKLDDAGGYARLHHWAVTQRDLFRTMQPITGVAPTLRRLSINHGIRIRLITHRLYVPHFHQAAVAQTVDWLEHHAIPFSDLCFVRDKEDVGADLYAEDAPHNIQQLQDDGQRVIIFSNSTNVHLSGLRANSWEEVEQLVLKEVADWKAGVGHWQDNGR